jgi:hypothetical protein
VARRIVLTAVASALMCLGVGTASAAASPVHLLLSGNGAFAVLGHWCGGISQKVYATGFASNGFPTGAEYLSTTCSSGGRGSKPVTYTASASSVWDWYGDTRSYSAISKAPEGISETFSAEDSHGDRIYNVGTSAYLEAPSPPIQAPAAPTNVTAYVSEIEVGGKVELRFQVGWTPASETAALLTSSHVVATPVGSTAPVLEATVNGGGSYVLLAPLERRTTYRITVTNTDPEGTSQPSTPIEVNSISPEEEREKKEEEAAPNPPEFGRCVKAASEKIGTTTYYYGGYTTATCTTASSTNTGKFEWEMGVVKGGFTTSLKLAPVTLEAANRTKLTCSGESGSGAITGRKTVGGVLLTFTGCESAGQKCSTNGHAAGEIASNALEGTLGVERITINKEGKEVMHIGLDLFPVGKAGSLLAYTCAGGEPQTLSGSVIAPVAAGKMQTSSTLKFSQSAGLQKPEAFEEGPRDVLTLGFGEQVGLSLNALLSTQEAVEINPAF